MDCKAFPGPSGTQKQSPYRMSSDEEDETPATEEEGNRRSVQKRVAIADSSIKLKTYQRRVSDYQKLQCANNYIKAAYLEVMRIAKEAGITWVISTPALGSTDDIVSEFQTPAPPGKKLEFSVATAVIPYIPAAKMASMMMFASKAWSRLLSPIVKYGEEYPLKRILQHLQNTDTAIDSVVKVHAEVQLPTTVVPTRYFDFLRYGKEIMRSVYIIVDISSNYFGHFCERSNSVRRPSGVIIRDRGPEHCEIIWVENVEVDKPRENIYSSITNSDLAFCANHWISTLLSKLRRKRSTFMDVENIDVDPRAGNYLLALTQSMEHFFMECVSEHPDEDILSVSTTLEDPIRILHNKTLKDVTGYVGLNSFRIQAKPQLVFEYLVRKDLQLEFRSSSPNPETSEEEPQQLFKFVTDDNSNIISLHRKKEMEEGRRYCLQEAWRDEYCSFILSKIMMEADVNLHLAGGIPSIHEESEERVADISTSGFAIMPDGPGGLQCNASLVTLLMQLHYHPKEGPVKLDSVRDDFEGDMNDIIRELNEEIVGMNE